MVFVHKLAERRWYIVQRGDAFDDVFLDVGGSREPSPGTYLLTGPDYHGRTKSDMIRIRPRTSLGFAVVVGGDGLWSARVTGAHGESWPTGRLEPVRASTCRG